MFGKKKWQKEIPVCEVRGQRAYDNLVRTFANEDIYFHIIENKTSWLEKKLFSLRDYSTVFVCERQGMMARELLRRSRIRGVKLVS